MHQFTVPLNILSQIRRVCACVFSRNLPPALLAESPGSFTCCCGNRNRYWNESPQKADPGEENSPATPARNQTCDLLITSMPVVYHWVFPEISISDPILCPQTQFEHMKLEVTVYWRYLHVTGNMHTPRQLSWFLWRGILFEIPIHFWRLEIKSIPQH